MLIQTEFRGPTASRGSRILAAVVEREVARRCSLAFDYALTARQNHEQAALLALSDAGLWDSTIRLAAVKSADEFFWIVEGED